MADRPLSNAVLHHSILKYIIDNGYAPDLHELAALLQAREDDVLSALQRLQDDHGIVLHPRSSRPWVIHPFSLAPTAFLVRDAELEWWGSCAWCSLGIAALLARDVTITTTLGANDRQVRVHIRDGRLIERDFVVHFPVPMRHAWENVIYTCSTMLLFDSEAQIAQWCRQHRVARGDVQPIATIWEFAKVWYGHHLDPDWKKWTTEEAQNIFDRFGLIGDTWQLPVSNTRF